MAEVRVDSFLDTLTGLVLFKQRKEEKLMAMTEFADVTHTSFYKNEKDPNGFSSSDAGAKLDANKPDLDLVLGDFSNALIEVGKVGTFGAKKYSRSGWLKVPNAISRYSSALWRHFLYQYNGEKIDTDSGLSHSAHLAWNALAKLELELLEEKRMIIKDNETNLQRDSVDMEKID